MTSQGKRELLGAIRPRYLRATKEGKARILDEFIAATGYHRKYAVRLLRNGPKPKGIDRRGRSKVYQGEVVTALEQVWEICGRICSKRLKPFLPEIVSVLERQEELVFTAATKGQLLQMSRATIDRCLKAARFPNRQGLSTTKPGSLLKSAIAVRTFADWNEAKPGFVEVDLVAHCGASTQGQYLCTLTVTDIATCWTECLALSHHTQQVVSAAIVDLRSRLPFPLLGIDSDNGSEFINDTLYRYCLTEQITFTRARPYKKNDQAHVEQKNWSVVRKLVGYDRFETEEELKLLEAIYADWRLYLNFFQPVMKLVEKHRTGSKVTKRYDTAATPYRRVLASPDVRLENKAALTYLYLRLNPVTLRDRIDANTALLLKISR
jgi:IS30 family transposase